MNNLKQKKLLNTFNSLNSGNDSKEIKIDE